MSCMVLNEECRGLSCELYGVVIVGVAHPDEVAVQLPCGVVGGASLGKWKPLVGSPPLEPDLLKGACIRPEFSPRLVRHLASVRRGCRAAQ